MLIGAVVATIYGRERTAVRIGFICKQGTANTYYRVLLPMTELQRRGHAVLWPGQHDYAAELAGRPTWDAFYVHQFMSEDDIRRMRQMAQQGIAVIWDSDDDILAVPKGSASYKRLGGRRKINRLFKQSVEAARAAHLMTTTNEHLANVYREAGVENVEVIPNYVATRDINRRRKRHQGVVVGITAANEHLADIESLRIGKALEAVMAKHAHVRVVAIGVDLRLGGPRYLHRGVVPIDRLIRAETEFDIGVAPLTDTPFNRSRSDIKVKEYAAAGAAWVASPVGPYLGLAAEHGGVLAANGAWESVASALAADHGRRRDLAQQATAWSRESTVERNSGRWDRAFAKARQLSGAIQRHR